MSATEQLTRLVANPTLTLNLTLTLTLTLTSVLTLIRVLTLSRWRVTRRCCTPSIASSRPACSHGSSRASPARVPPRPT